MNLTDIEYSAYAKNAKGKIILQSILITFFLDFVVRLKLFFHHHSFIYSH